MPHLTAQCARQGPLLDLLIGVSAPRQQALEAAALPVPPPKPIRGLIDTGASCTCVDPSVFAQLGITPTGMTSIVTPSTGETPHVCNQFDVRIVLVHPESSIAFNALPVIESRLAHQGFQALIGRDMLSRCLLVYDGKHGAFSLAF